MNREPNFSNRQWREIFCQLTDIARVSIVLAREAAQEFCHPEIDTEHFLWGLVCREEGTAPLVFVTEGITLDTLREVLRDQILQLPCEKKKKNIIPMSHCCQNALQLSQKEAVHLGHPYIGTEHLLLGLLREERGRASEIIRHLGFELDSTRQKVLKLLERD